MDRTVGILLVTIVCQCVLFGLSTVQARILPHGGMTNSIALPSSHHVSTTPQPLFMPTNPPSRQFVHSNHVSSSRPTGAPPADNQLHGVALSSYIIKIRHHLNRFQQQREQQQQQQLLLLQRRKHKQQQRKTTLIVPLSTQSSTPMGSLSSSAAASPSSIITQIPNQTPFPHTTPNLADPKKTPGTKLSRTSYGDITTKSPSSSSSTNDAMSIPSRQGSRLALREKLTSDIVHLLETLELMGESFTTKPTISTNAHDLDHKDGNGGVHDTQIDNDDNVGIGADDGDDSYNNEYDSNDFDDDAIKPRRHNRKDLDHKPVPAFRRVSPRYPVNNNVKTFDVGHPHDNSEDVDDDNKSGDNSIADDSQVNSIEADSYHKSIDTDTHQNSVDADSHENSIDSNAHHPRLDGVGERMVKPTMSRTTNVPGTGTTASIPSQSWREQLAKMSVTQLIQIVARIRAAVKTGANSDGEIVIGTIRIRITKITTIKISDLCCLL